ncbi:metalloregulator ArsR/SmtB family transcription factor [soil metagenome]
MPGWLYEKKNTSTMALALLPQQQITLVAHRFRLLGDPSRLALLNLLHVHGEMNVQDLCAAADQQQANVSKHLRLLLDEGLVARRQEGPFAFYSIADPMLAALCLLVCASIES